MSAEQSELTPETINKEAIRKVAKQFAALPEALDELIVSLDEEAEDWE